MNHYLHRLILSSLATPLLVIWRLWGWRVEHDLPNIPRYVILGVPHTTNWDYLHMLAVAMHARRRPHVTVKHTLFRGPVGWFIKFAGGIPIDRTRSSNVVEQLAARLKAAERMILVFTPEGTRSKSPHWKTGFYYTALKAGVPIVCAYIDYRRKCVGSGLVIQPTGDIHADFIHIRAFYETHGYPKYPENWTPLSLPDEVMPQTS